MEGKRASLGATLNNITWFVFIYLSKIATGIQIGRMSVYESRGEAAEHLRRSMGLLESRSQEIRSRLVQGKELVGSTNKITFSNSKTVTLEIS